MRSYRISGLGAANPLYEVFQGQLSNYKQILTNLYRRKSKAIAERESLRFQYLTGAKSLIQSAISNIRAESYVLGSTNLVNEIIPLIINGIPMTDLKGIEIQGWGGPLYGIGGPHQVNYLSPIETILVLPYNDPSYSDDLRPTYLLSRANWDGSLTVDQIMDWSWFHQLKAWDNNGNLMTGKIPLSKEFVENWLRRRGLSESLIEELDAANSIFTKEFNGKSLKSIIDSAELLLREIILKTQQVVNIQLDIDQAETDLADFIEAYKGSFAANLNLNQLLSDLEADASKPIPVEVPVGTTVVETAPASVVAPLVSEAEITVVEPIETKKSNLPLIAAAAVGAFLLTRK